ncbi:MAG: polysaccharide pyruvyl transferase family protein [Lachnospiraceae bacterium]|nr:polysaccharide pyruvyl transferase family protein [Lachnospiraceae bacterium]
MRVGILTFHRAYNYGAVLQAYALTKVLNKDENIQCELVDYKNEYIEKTYRIFRGGSLKHPKGLIRNIRYIPRNIKVRKAFRNFRDNYLTISSESYTKDQLFQIENNYDYFITGSDQVWNSRLTGEDSAFFLDFVSDYKKKTSYAASFGSTSIDVAEVKKIGTYLSDFRFLTVREDSAKDFLSNSLGLESSVMPDPTMLLSKEEWDEVVEEPRQGQKYVLLFLMSENKNLISNAKKYADKHGLKLIFINLYSFTKIKGATILTGVSVPNWLGYIKNAECVFTNSYHGMVFSLIFNTSFYYEMLHVKNATNSRFETLLNSLGVGNRLLEKLDDIGKCDDIDFSIVNQKMRLNREAVIDRICTFYGSIN